MGKCNCGKIFSSLSLYYSVLKSTIAINAAEWTLSFHSLKVESDLKVKPLTVFERVWHSSLCFSCYLENETVYNISPSWNCCAFRSYIIQKPFWRSFQELEVKSDLKVKLTVFEKDRGQLFLYFSSYFENETFDHINPSWNCCALKISLVQAVRFRKCFRFY